MWVTDANMCLLQHVLNWGGFLHLNSFRDAQKLISGPLEAALSFITLFADTVSASDLQEDWKYATTILVPDFFT